MFRISFSFKFPRAIPNPGPALESKQVLTLCTQTAVGRQTQYILCTGVRLLAADMCAALLAPQYNNKGALVTQQGYSIQSDHREGVVSQTCLEENTVATGHSGSGTQVSCFAMDLVVYQN
jgi:hypothetical protein